MKLTKAKIINFRSIKDVTISFDPPCVVLVGINESGKSNILQALALLSPNTKFDDFDVRQGHPQEEYPEKSYVEFYFKFDEAELTELIDHFSSKIIGDRKTVIAYNEKTALYVTDLCKLNAKATYYVDVLNKKRVTRYHSFKEDTTIPENIVLTSSASTNLPVRTKNGKEFKLMPNMILDLNDLLEDIAPNYYELLTLNKLSELYGEEVRKVCDKVRPDAILWKYSEANLLPDKIDLAQFTSTPDTCPVLKYMFNLAGIIDISTEIQTAQKRGQTGIRNLLNRVAIVATQHLRDVWKDYKTIKFELHQNGNQIDASIKDEHNYFPMKFRSDGFKQFATFLLTVSARVEKGELANNLLLMDEPGVHLHPSGCRSLRDELIKISMKNLVVYSTHSIFMIDKEKLCRHRIVKKREEITYAEQATDSNFVDEEVIFNALGHSIFADLKRKNIIFEGWRDKRLFEVAHTKVPKNYAELREFYREFGLCYVKGVKQIDFFTPLLALADRDCVIITDSDIPAKEKQNNHLENKGFGTWYTYDNLCKSMCVTAEDFIKSASIKKYLDELKIKEGFQIDIAEQHLQNPPKGKMQLISQWLTQNNVSQENQKILLNKFKEQVFAQLTPNQIEESYYEMLLELKNKITK